MESMNGLRAFKGSSVTRRLSITVPRSALPRSRRGVSAATVSCSLRSPTDSSTLTVAVWLTSSRTRRVYFLKPGISTASA